MKSTGAQARTAGGAAKMKPSGKERSARGLRAADAVRGGSERPQDGDISIGACSGLGGTRRTGCERTRVKISKCFQCLLLLLLLVLWLFCFSVMQQVTKHKRRKWKRSPPSDPRRPRMNVFDPAATCNYNVWPTFDPLFDCWRRLNG